MPHTNSRLEKYYSQYGADPARGLFLVDGQGGIIDINSVFTDLLGYSHREIIGCHFAQLRYSISQKGEKQGEFISSFGLFLFHRAEEQDIPLILRHKKGHAVSVRLRSVPSRDSEGAIIETLGLIEPWAGEQMMLGVSPDGTQDWKQWETKDNYKNIIEHSGDAIFLADFNTRIVTVNNAGIRLLGYDKADFIIGKSLLDFAPFRGSFLCTTGETIIFDKEWGTQQITHTKELYAQGVVHCEMYFVRADGLVVPMDATLSLLKDQSGKPRGTITVCRDITERKRTLLDLQRAHDELERKVQERTVSLEETNIAMRVLLDARNEDRADVGQRLLSHINNLVLPYLEKLRASGLPEPKSTHLEIAETNLREIIAPFTEHAGVRMKALTPAEIQVASLVKQGKTSKEIAALLHLSVETVDTHRKNIRKKLGIQRKKTNLRTFLSSS